MIGSGRLYVCRRQVTAGTAVLQKFSQIDGSTVVDDLRHEHQVGSQNVRKRTALCSLSVLGDVLFSRYMGNLDLVFVVLVVILNDRVGYCLVSGVHLHGDGRLIL